LKYLKPGLVVFLAIVILLGYAADRSGPPEGGDVQAESTEPEASRVWDHAVEALGIPAGPWVTYRPPRKARPRLYAEAACVVDCEAGSVLYGKREDRVRPIASLTKLLTALVYLESGGTFDQEIEITPEDARGAGKSVLWKHHRFKAEDVFYTALMSSDNRAARALARSTFYSPDQFIARMNRKAQEIGCRTLHVEEPTGLSEKNVASAVDVARLLAAAMANSTIREVCQTYRREFRASNSKKKYRIVNSNRLLLSKYDVVGGKTGYIVEAGWCVASMFSTNRGPLSVVVLGARSNSSRFAQARKLTAWALKYRDRTPSFALADQAAS